MRVLAVLGLLCAMVLLGLMVVPGLTLLETGEAEGGSIQTFFENAAPFLTFLLAFLGAGTVLALIAGVLAFRR